MLNLLKATVLFGILIYATLAGTLYLLQERFIFPAPAYVGSPEQISDFETLSIKTPDGEKLFALYREPPKGAPTILVFHGNADSAVGQLAKGRMLAAAGFGVLLVEYRGYPGSTGHPTEQGLITDALAAYDFAVSRSKAPIGLYAHSLGTGVALQLAVQRPVFAIVLEAPYDSILAIAGRSMWWLPVPLLLKHPFRSDLAIAKLNLPILILHGVRDRIIPVADGKLLAERGGSNVIFKEVPGAGHYLFTHGSGEEAVAFFERHRSF